MKKLLLLLLVSGLSYGQNFNFTCSIKPIYTHIHNQPDLSEPGIYYPVRWDDNGIVYITDGDQEYGLGLWGYASASLNDAGYVGAVTSDPELFVNFTLSNTNTILVGWREIGYTLTQDGEIRSSAAFRYSQFGCPGTDHLETQPAEWYFTQIN